MIQRTSTHAMRGRERKSERSPHSANPPKTNPAAAIAGRCWRAAAAGPACSSAGVGPKDVDVFATYDSFSVHLLASLEGFGFCKEGEGGAFVQNGRIEIGGELPCNTSGGMLSESYMQSWNHQPELVRQLRGGLGARHRDREHVAREVGRELGLADRAVARAVVGDAREAAQRDGMGGAAHEQDGARRQESEETEARATTPCHCLLRCASMKCENRRAIQARVGAPATAARIPRPV